jgi:indolepyruvate ferredoxin oxidoreductase beta subunit
VRTGATFSPYIPPGGADLLLAFELCEGARHLPRLKKTGAALVNTARIEPVTVALGQAVYDEDKMRTYIASSRRAHFIAADVPARGLGAGKTANIVLLGAAFALGLLDLSEESLLASLERNVPPKHLEMNRAAWKAGLALIIPE